MLFYLALLFAVVISVDCTTQSLAYTECATQAALDGALDGGAVACASVYGDVISCTCDEFPSCSTECSEYMQCAYDNPTTFTTACAEQETASTDCLAGGTFEPTGAGPCYDGSLNTIDGCTCHESCLLCGYNDTPPTAAEDCIVCADGGAVTSVYADGTGTCDGSDGGNDDGSDDMCMVEMTAWYTCTATNSCTDEQDLYFTCIMAAQEISTECTTEFTAVVECDMANEDTAGTCTTHDALEDALEECAMMNSGDDCMVCMAPLEDSCPDESDVTAHCTCLCSNCFDDCPAVMMAACADSSQADCITFCEGDYAAGDDVDFDMCGCDAGVAPDACGVCGGDAATCATGTGDGDGAMGLLLSVVFFLQAFLW